MSSNLVDLADLPPIPVWEGVIARRVQGERLTLAVVELAPNAIVPEHRHPNEQNGLVIQGRVLFRCGDEERELGPGGTWRILGGVPHSVVAGPDGAVAHRRVHADPRRLGPLRRARPAADLAVTGATYRDELRAPSPRPTARRCSSAVGRRRATRGR